MKKLTEKQKRVYDFIVSTTADRGYPPSIREICQGLGISSPSTAHAHVSALAAAGYIQKEPGKTRALALTGESYRKIPVMGTVTAGQPILAVENIEGYVPYHVERGDGDFFALRIKGDSMIGAGILDGDLVVVRKQSTADSGQIVVSLLEEEATCKRLKKENGNILLMPENPAYEPIPGNHAQILGRVVSVIRETV